MTIRRQRYTAKLEMLNGIRNLPLKIRNLIAWNQNLRTPGQWLNAGLDLETVEVLE